MTYRLVGTVCLLSSLLLASGCSHTSEVPDRYLQPSDVEGLGLDVEEVEPTGALVSLTSCTGPDWHQELGRGGGVVYDVGVGGTEDGGSLRDDIYAVEETVLQDLWTLVDGSPEECPSSTPVELDEGAVRAVASAVGVDASDVRVIRRQDDQSAQWRVYVHDDGMLVVVQADGTTLVPSVDLTSAATTAFRRADDARSG